MFKKILLTTDFSDLSMKIFEEAIKLTLIMEGKLILCHVSKSTDISIDSLQFKEEITIKLQDLAKKDKNIDLDKLDWDLEMLFGDSIVDEIIRYSENFGIDLIMLSTHGRTGVKRLLTGSNAEKLIRHSKIPVLSYNTKDLDK